MNQSEFIDKCVNHNWHYKHSSNIHEYSIGKREEMDLIAMVQRNHELAEIFLIFQSGWFEKQDVA